MVLDDNRARSLNRRSTIEVTRRPASRRWQISKRGPPTVRFYPRKRTFRHLFDHLIGTVEQRRWHREAERLGTFEVDDQLGICGLLLFSDVTD